MFAAVQQQSFDQSLEVHPIHWEPYQSPALALYCCSLSFVTGPEYPLSDWNGPGAQTPHARSGGGDAQAQPVPDGLISDHLKRRGRRLRTEQSGTQTDSGAATTRQRQRWSGHTWCSQPVCVVRQRGPEEVAYRGLWANAWKASCICLPLCEFGIFERPQSWPQTQSCACNQSCCLDRQD